MIFTQKPSGTDLAVLAYIRGRLTKRAMLWNDVIFHGGLKPATPSDANLGPAADSDKEWVAKVAEWHKSFKNCTDEGLTMPKVKGAKRSCFAPVTEELKVRFVDYGYVFGLLVLFTHVCWNLTHSTIRHQISLLVRACSVVQDAQLWQSAQVQQSQWCSSAPVDGSFRFHHFNIDFCLPMSR